MPTWMKHLTNGRVFETANEGKPGGDAEAQAAAAAAEALAAETAAAEQAAAAELAKKNSKGDPKISDAEAALLREVMDKKEKLKTTSKDLDDAKAALAAYDGIDPVMVKALLKEKKDAETADLEAKGEFTRVKAMMAEEHARDTAAKDAKILELTADAAAKDKLIDTLTIGNTFANSPFISTELLISPAHTRRLYGDRFGMKDGALVGYDKPEGASDRTVLVDAAGNPLSFDDALKRVIEADPESVNLKKTKIKPGAGGKSVDTLTKKEAPADTGLRGAARIAATLSSMD